MAGLAASLGKEGASALRWSCGKTEAAVLFSIAVVLVSVFWAIGFPRWARLLPLWISLGYAFLYIPARVYLDNTSEAAFKASGLSKSEWLGTISADQRTRLTIFASISAALIVSANAWISRWEAQQNKDIAAREAAQKGLATMNNT